MLALHSLLNIYYYIISLYAVQCFGKRQNSPEMENKMCLQQFALPLPGIYRGELRACSTGWCLWGQCSVQARGQCARLAPALQGVLHCPAKPCSVPPGGPTLLQGAPAGGRPGQPPAGGRYIILDRSNHWSDYILLVITVVIIVVAASPYVAIEW